MKVILASTNNNKFKELSLIINSLGLDIELISQNEFKIPETKEPHSTFLENALEKSRKINLITGLPTIGEDSGLCVQALNNEPGIYSSRYSSHKGCEKNNNDLLISNLKNVLNRKASYISSMVFLLNHSDSRPITGEGIWNGVIIDKPRGTNGFGYDFHFYIPKLKMTAAELTIEEKNKISHRALAFQELIKKIQIFYDQNKID